MSWNAHNNLQLSLVGSVQHFPVPCTVFHAGLAPQKIGMLSSLSVNACTVHFLYPYAIGSPVVTSK